MSVTLADIEAAHRRISPYIHHTPVMESERLNELVGAWLFFKCEHLQKTGAFKTRGAVNAIFSLSDDEVRQGVATHSSGNHGSALARAAKLRGVPAYIVLPGNARRVKKETIYGYGAEIIECEATLAARESMLDEVVARTGAVFIPPYDDDRIIAGQGTAALELVNDVSALDALIVPVGGGGLLAGTSIVAKGMTSDTENSCAINVYGAEPEMADDAFRSFRSGERVGNHVPATMADGLSTTLGERNFAIIKDLSDGILLVSEDEIVAAMHLIWTRLKQVVEPSAAVTLAAAIRYPQIFTGKRIGLILTGGNLDLSDLPF
ncbi:MAG: pyridoxal-phosphate dependent enzyme [Pseudomonadales bacterium]